LVTNFCIRNTLISDSRLVTKLVDALEQFNNSGILYCEKTGCRIRILIGLTTMIKHDPYISDFQGLGLGGHLIESSCTGALLLKHAEGPVQGDGGWQHEAVHQHQPGSPASKP